MDADGFYSLAERHVYQRAFRQADEATFPGRAPTRDEIARYLTPCEQKMLGIFGYEHEPDELEELEAMLVPCGC